MMTDAEYRRDVKARRARVAKEYLCDRFEGAKVGCSHSSYASSKGKKMVRLDIRLAGTSDYDINELRKDLFEVLRANGLMVDDISINSAAWYSRPGGVLLDFRRGVERPQYFYSYERKEKKGSKGRASAN